MPANKVGSVFSLTVQESIDVGQDVAVYEDGRGVASGAFLRCGAFFHVYTLRKNA